MLDDEVYCEMTPSELIGKIIIELNESSHIYPALSNSDIIYDAAKRIYQEGINQQIIGCNQRTNIVNMYQDFLLDKYDREIEEIRIKVKKLLNNGIDIEKLDDAIFIDLD